MYVIAIVGAGGKTSRIKNLTKEYVQQGKKVRLLLAEVVDNLIWHRFRVASIYDIIEALLLFERK